MTSHDIFQSLDRADDETLQRVVDRMELRGRDPRFVKMRAAYLDAADLASANSFLDLGCGTGLDARAAARRPEFRGIATGVDLSPGMIEAGKRFAAEEGVASRVDLRAGDAASVGLPDAAFDVVVASTLVSHVESPPDVIAEASRLLAPDGRLVIFDADFASLTFAYPDAAIERQMQDALLQTFVANTRVMRAMPGLLRDAGLRIVEVQPSVVADVGAGGFFGNMVEMYTPLVTRFDLMPAPVVDAWLAEQRAAIKEERFFASLTFYAYVLAK
jgi:ubiquinone/menaquinone biosynthesis C-methylase UbiE